MEIPNVKVEPWFASLPLTDPRCKNDSCNAFKHEHLASQAEVSWKSQFLYGHYAAWIFSGIIFLFSVHFFFQSFIEGKKKKGVSDRPSLLDKLVAFIRSVSYRRLRGRVAQYLAVPSLGVAIIILLSWAAATALAFAQHPCYRGKSGYGSPPLSIRAGLMSFALVPLIFATAGKVNLITVLTGIGHEKLNVFHRWTSYLMLYLTLLHVIPFFVQPFREGGFAALHAHFYYPGGLMYTGTPFFGMLVGLSILSIPSLRRRFYELFVHIHIILSIVFLALGFWHTKDIGDSWAYLWATLAIFLFQFFVRWFGKTSTLQLTQTWFDQAPVLMTRLEESMVKLELEVQGNWKWEPGQHVFLRFATLRPLDNHPFTIANISEKREGMINSSRMVFYVRPQQGMTKRIATLADSGKKVAVTVDGPYGTIIRPHVERRFDNVMLVAGGGGIFGMFPWLEYLSKHIGKPDAAIQTLTLVWVVRKKAALSWAFDELEAIKARAPSGTLKFDIWVTNDIDEASTNPSSADEASADEASADEKQVGSGSRSFGSRSSSSQEFPYDLFPGAHVGKRPDMSDVLQRLVGGGKTIILGCGPESLKADLSNSVAALQSKVFKGEAQEIRLHTETFGW